MFNLADLEAIIGPPIAPPPVVDWTAIEEYTGLIFPDDYKQWASKYPTLEFDEFLLVSHPGIDSDAQGYVQGWSDVLDNMRQWSTCFGKIELVGENGATETYPAFPVYPDVGGLFPWGSTTNGDYCCWLTDPDPSRWTIVITTLHQWWRYSGTFTDLMVGLLTGQVQCPIFGAEGLVGAHGEQILQ